MASEIVKYLVVNLINEVTDLHTKKYKTLIKGVEESTNKKISIFVNSKV